MLKRTAHPFFSPAPSMLNLQFPHKRREKIINFQFWAKPNGHVMLELSSNLEIKKSEGWHSLL